MPGRPARKSRAGEEDCQQEIVRKIYALNVMKKEQAQRLGKFFANMNASGRKLLLPRVTAALFGETTYEIEIMRHAQMYNYQPTM